MPILKVGPEDFIPQLIVFDKDGTLIDFDAMWGGWMEDLADRLETYSGRRLRTALFDLMGYDETARRTLAGGHLAVSPMADIRALIQVLLRQQGLNEGAASAVMSKAWMPPDPVLHAKPFVPLPDLFSRLRTVGLKVAVATSDDRLPTEGTLDGLGAKGLVDGLVCADDGLPVKPAPDMILNLCARLGIPPAKTVMVGDSLADLQMGRAAGAGLLVGVSSGVSSKSVLAELSDVVLPSVAGLI